MHYTNANVENDGCFSLGQSINRRQKKSLLSMVERLQITSIQIDELYVYMTSVYSRHALGEFSQNVRSAPQKSFLS